MYKMICICVENTTTISYRIVFTRLTLTSVKILLLVLLRYYDENAIHGVDVVVATEKKERKSKRFPATKRQSR